MRTRASPSRGVGFSTSTYSRTPGSPVFETRMACMGISSRARLSRAPAAQRAVEGGERGQHRFHLSVVHGVVEREEDGLIAQALGDGQAVGGRAPVGAPGVGGLLVRVADAAVAGDSVAEQEEQHLELAGRTLGPQRGRVALPVAARVRAL